MKEIFKTLSKLILPITIIIILLALQAMCDLKLPDYTAKIVNIGIQQGGIENSVPEVITEESFNFINMLADNKDVIASNYTLIEQGNSKYIEKYPILKEENLYLLKDVDDNTLKKIEETIKIPEVILINANSNSEQISNVSNEQLALKLNEAKEQLSKMEDSLLTQMSVVFVKSEYEKIGMNTEKVQMNYIAKAGIQMLSLAFIIMLITIVTVFLSARVAAKFGHDLRSKTVNKVMKFANQDMEDLSVASLITRSTNDVQQIQMLIVMLLRIVIYAPIVGFGALSKVNGNSMAWVIGVAVLAILSLVIILFTIVLPKFKLVQKLIDRVNLVAREILTGLPVIRAFSNETYEEERFDKANKDLTKLNLFVNRVMTIMMPTMMFIMNGVSILIIWVGASKIDAGTMQVGTLMAFITYTMQIIMSFLMISMVSIMLPRSWVSIKRISEIFNKEISIKEKESLVSFDENKKGVVEFKDVYFRYPDAEEDVIENISFKAMPGTTTAFIGSTGSGKSTLINLIPRFFDVTGGKILIDGVNIKDVSIKELRKKIGFVPQKGTLFTGTIESNIKFGNDDMSDDEMKKALEVAQALDFVLEKENQFDSEISQGGTNVSGGQRQRLAIARAIAINPEIYIFDDSFSALDYKTDAKLRKELLKYTKGSTIFIVAQRISTVLQADQIVVLDQGCVVGIGKHSELMKNCEIYKQIALSQLSKEELENE